jgi:hypothetical protein
VQLYANQPLIKRNKQIGRILTYLGLGLTVAAAVIVFRAPAYTFWALLIMLVGGLISQIGTAFTTRFGQEPRVDQIINSALKGLDDRYAVFHYLLGSDHVLVTPDGVFALIPRWEKGEVIYKQGSWTNKKPKGRLGLPTRTRELRGIEKETQRELQSLDRSLQKHLDSSEDLTTKPMLVFLAEDANLELENPPILVAHRKKLKDTVRSLERGKSLDEEGIDRLAASIRR